MAVRTNFGFSPPEADAGVLPDNFLVRNGFEGTQVLITWDAVDLGLVSQIQLVRKLGSYPVLPTDGTLLLTGLKVSP